MQENMFQVTAEAKGSALALHITGPGQNAADGPLSFLLADKTRGFLDFHLWLAQNFGTRMPVNGAEPPPATFEAVFIPVLTENISGDVLYGYGDPSMMRVANQASPTGWDYYLTFTSNDAANSFPIIHSHDMYAWALSGFAFQAGHKPYWVKDGKDVSDFWAPEIHAVGDKFILCYTAREKDGTLAIGIGESDHPAGPFKGPDHPLIGGGVIDSHIFVEQDGTPYLFWKDDNNDIWPKLLIALMEQVPDTIPELFPDAADQRTVQFMTAALPLIRQWEPMEQAMMFEPVIDAAVEDFIHFRGRVLHLIEKAQGQAYQSLVIDIKNALATPFNMQELDPQTLCLVGKRQTVIENDQDWEGHIIEGMYIYKKDSHYYMFYAGNSFGNHKYGIGVAVAKNLAGPYTKLAGPFLQSTAAWSGPGHPSVVLDLDNNPTLVLHAFPPKVSGYKAFRAFLLASIDFDSGNVSLKK